MSKKPKEHRYSISLVYFDKKTKQINAREKSVVRCTPEEFVIKKKQRLAQAREFAKRYKIGWCYQEAIVRGNKWPKYRVVI